MSDHDLRSAERAALTGDQDSQARLDQERWRTMTTTERLRDRLTRAATGAKVSPLDSFPVARYLAITEVGGWDGEETLVCMVQELVALAERLGQELLEAHRARCPDPQEHASRRVAARAATATGRSADDLYRAIRTTLDARESHELEARTRKRETGPEHQSIPRPPT